MAYCKIHLLYNNHFIPHKNNFIFYLTIQPYMVKLLNNKINICQK